MSSRRWVVGLEKAWDAARLRRAVSRPPASNPHPAEQHVVLDARLDAYISFVYRALKSHRDGRPLECRLDAAEAVPWLLDVPFALTGRVRPYNKYLAWEPRERPLALPEWEAQVLLPQLECMLDGDADALRDVFAVVERECRRFDATHGHQALGNTIDDWGAELDLLRGEFQQDVR